MERHQHWELPPLVHGFHHSQKQGFEDLKDLLEKDDIVNNPDDDCILKGYSHLILLTKVRSNLFILSYLMELYVLSKVLFALTELGPSVWELICC